MKKKLIGIGICMLMIVATVLPVVGAMNKLENIKEIMNNGKTNTHYQIHITSHLATSEEIKKIGQQCGIFNPNKNYNIKFECHGTGLAPPTESDYSHMIGSLQIIDHISSNQPLNSSCDLSNDPCFPSVGDQGYQGSCAAWAATYYTTGYVIGKNLNWTQAHTGNITQLLSPAWTYNKCNYGADHGSSRYNNLHVIQTVGCSRLCTMPYNDSDPVSWGDENAWRDAPPYRVNNIYSIHAPYNNSTISSIKTLLSGGQPIGFDLDASSYGNFGSDDVLGSNAMLLSINHANTIVGYNDSKQDRETGETGALKIVNSWGSTWGPDNNGYYWMTYQAFIDTWNTNPLNYDDVLYVNSTPKLLAVWELNPACDRSATVELGIGPYDNPLATRQPLWDGFSNVMHNYPHFMCLDVTEFYSIWKTFVDDFYLKIGLATLDGTIISFKLEYYQYDYSPGNATYISDESPDVPKNTPCHVDLYFPYILPPVADFTWTPQNPLTNQQITFDASASHDPNGTIIRYEWDWNHDGVYDETHNTPTATHAWADPGNYTVTLRVTDDHGLADTKTKTVIVSQNHPPDTPTIAGPEKGKPGVSYKYTITGTDPESDMVSAYVKWGDDTITNWTAFHSSGEAFTVTHSWANKGTYTVQVKVKDEHGAESDWATLKVSMPISNNIPFLDFWEWLFERFPNAFPILRYLLGY